MTTFADRIISFCNDLDFTGSLPEGISVMNPFRNDPEVSSAVSRFYRKYYNDNQPRYMIIGINPGRFGAGATGIPFTDTIRLEEICGINIKGIRTRETSSVFIYQMIDRYGGPDKFYRDFFISAVSPLGFTSRSKTGKEVNYNYYDSKELTEAVFVFIVESLKKQMEFGIKNDVCFCLGTGKNYSFLSKLNDEFRFFGRIEPLEHPRFIMQYRAKKQQYYIDLYIEKLRERDS
jgi:hypothetical protein